MKDEDVRLQRRVLDELQFEPSVDATHIGVTADDGVVTLSGHVASYAEKLAAEVAVRRVRGVKAIAQDMEVHLPSAAKTADDEIAGRAVRLLDWDAAVPVDAVKVKVEDGWITLTGEVEWQYQRAAAEHAVQKLGGVVGVLNHITLHALVQPADIRRRIEEALQRDARVEAGTITINTSGSRVELHGRVHSYHERDAAERAAWSAPGVTEVKDRLLVA